MSPNEIFCDNANTFTAKLWESLHKNLGTLVTYSPVYHPSTMGHIERTHRDIKVALKAALLQMGDKHQAAWMGWSGGGLSPRYWQFYHSDNAHKPQTNNVTNKSQQGPRA